MRRRPFKRIVSLLLCLCLLPTAALAASQTADLEDDPSALTDILSKATSAETVTPDGAMTRQAVWMVLARMSGETPDNVAQAREWAMENNISDGSDPTAAITRQQFVTMLWRYARQTGADVSVGEDTNILSYEDAFGISDYAFPALQWACGAGIMSGYADGTLRPHSAAPRTHVAAMLRRYITAETAVL